jgi:hypothetical protein
MKTQVSSQQAAQYPNISHWIHMGCVEISYDTGRFVVARASDSKGVVWEGAQYQSTDEAMKALDSAIAQFI